MKLVPKIEHPLNVQYPEISTRFDSEQGIYWTIVNQASVPCFTKSLLNQLLDHHHAIRDSNGCIFSNNEIRKIRYSVLCSTTPGIYSLGGQLSLFSELIRAKNKTVLLEYATQCIDVITPRISHFNFPVITISLIRGDALGGGFEGALISDVLIAERQSQMGFPEILFNLFPGMGAYSLLSRKVGEKLAEKMILSGKMYSAEELFEMGVVDVLVEEGRGEQAVYDYVKKQERRANGVMAVQKVRDRVNPISYEELIDIANIWVEAALKLSENDLRVMDFFVRAQEKRFGLSAPLPSAAQLRTA